MKSPVFMTIRELSQKIRNREFTPTEITEIFLNRLETYGNELNAVVTITKKRARKQAKKAEKEFKKGKIRGLLHGIPYGVKDLLATSGGIPTTWGAAPFRSQIFDYDATVIKRLDKAGAILTAKLAMIELAGGMGYRQPNASFTGPCKTPWSMNHWAGGSSSGSGAVVGAGLLPFTIGSETWGSILSPAGNCGVSGLRPTYGRVSRYGAMALSWTLDKLGPLALSADDCGIILEAISGYDKNDQSTLRKKYTYSEERSTEFKVAMLKDSNKELPEDISSNFDEAIRVVTKIGSVEEIEFPEFPYEAITRTILNGEAASAFEDFTESGKAAELTAPEDRYGPYARTIVLAKDYLKALRLRKYMAKIAEKVMLPYDAVLAPGRRSIAPEINKEFKSIAAGTIRDYMGAIGNGVGLPSISVPNGFSNGLPTSIQFMGRVFDENKIITLANAYQNRTNWHTKHPAIFTV
jgi:aspartyl-tRNA(Asn)/glutamyl-tRNA(Gln) amidotransferase subunit A